MVFDYVTLPRQFQRRYVPAGIAFEWSDLSPLFQELESRKIESTDGLKQWLTDEDELDAMIHEQKILRIINVSRQTDDQTYKGAYTAFIQNLDPLIKVAKFKLMKRYTLSAFRRALPQDYQVTDRQRANAVSIFREENVELEKMDGELVQQYQSTMGAITVFFNDAERTIQQMSRFYEDTDRMVRMAAWKLSEARLLEDAGRLDLIFDQMIKHRDKIAGNAGFENFRDYAFRLKNRFDYTPEDCLAFCDAVERYFVPLSRKIDREREERMGLDDLMPWDLKADPDGKPPLTPFSDTAELVDKCSKVFEKVDPQLSLFFTKMVHLDLLDLDSRKGKAPGGFQEDFSEIRLPFIFMNAAGMDSDLRILLHESGHCFQTFLVREASLPFYYSCTNIPMEFGEVASTSMELIGGEHLAGIFYDREAAKRSNLNEVVRIIKAFTWVATIESFQHWVYTNPRHSHKEREAAWTKTFQRFAGLENYEGFEDYRRYRWQRQIHLYQFPFYNIEYGIAALGALGIWLRYRRNPAEGIAVYKRALSLGGSKPLPDLFRAAELPWDFGSTTMEKYSEELDSILRTYY